MSANGVREQYESLPYPARDPRDESRRLIVGSPSHLAEIDHYVLGGRLDAGWIAAGRPFRALVAGGGTGDATVMLAQQARDRGLKAEILHVDLSDASIAVASARARARGLDGVAFRQGSFLDPLPEAPFDYIDCCGVLHHLPDPAAGIAALAAALAPHGGIGLMLYGALGRRGVYDVQEILRTLAPDGAPGPRVATARRLLQALPQTNWLARNPFIADHLKGDDAGLFDLLLHPVDRAYRVPDILALLDGAALAAAAFLPEILYEPGTHLADAALNRRVAGAAQQERWALAELISGAMSKHVLYALPRARADRSPPRSDDPDVIPVPKDIDPAQLAAALLNGQVPVVTVGAVRHRPTVSAAAAKVLAHVDGVRSLRAIHSRMQQDKRILALDDVVGAFGALYAALRPLGSLLLKRGAGG